MISFIVPLLLFRYLRGIPVSIYVDRVMSIDQLINYFCCCSPLMVFEKIYGMVAKNVLKTHLCSFSVVP